MRSDAAPLGHAERGFPQWHVSDRRIGYAEAVRAMEQRVDRISRGEADELVWLVEHSPLYTAGTSARTDELLEPDRFPVHRTGRGGRFTYHGPGQRVVYVMLDLTQRGSDVRAFVGALEDWIIAALGDFNVRGEKREGRIGVWVARKDTGSEDKIAAIGVRVRRWVSFHGVSLNVEPDLGHYAGIVPCGVSEFGVTSLVDLGIPVTMAEVDEALRLSFPRFFGPCRVTAGDPAELHPEFVRLGAD